MKGSSSVEPASILNDIALVLLQVEGDGILLKKFQEGWQHTTNWCSVERQTIIAKPETNIASGKRAKHATGQRRLGPSKNSRVWCCEGLKDLRVLSDKYLIDLFPINEERHPSIFGWLCTPEH